MSGNKRDFSSSLECPAGATTATDDEGNSRRNEGEYTSFRRTTRSILSRTTNTNTTAESNSASASASTSTMMKRLDVARYAYKPATSSSPRKRVKIETEEVTPLAPRRSIKVEHISTPSDPSDPLDKSPKAKVKAKGKAKAMPLVALVNPHPAPPGWEEQYRLIEKMRKSFIAPVDDMGCERPQTAVTDPKTTRFHILISLMLSSQTKDAITSSALTLLHTTLPGGLTAQSLASAPVELVEGCINKVGFWRRKAEYIQSAARTLLEGNQGDVPRTIEGLCELKGVGPKMAFLALQCAWDIEAAYARYRNAGIGVDVHVHRITNRLSWHKPATQTPEQTRINLESWLPPNLHKSINPLLVGFGQVICLPVGPRCDVCLLAKEGICPSRQIVKKGRKEVVYDFDAGGKEDGAKVDVEYEESEQLNLQKIDDGDEQLQAVMIEGSVLSEDVLQRQQEVQKEMVKKETEW